MSELFLLAVIATAIFIIILLSVYVISTDLENERVTEVLTVKIKYLRDIKPIQFIDEGDWIDLRAGADIELEAGGSCIIPLGVAMEIPRGYTAIVAPRSSTFKKWGIIMTNSIGIIDESYKGDDDEWGFPALAFRKTKIHKNDRICQFRLIKQSDYIDFIEVKKLGNPNRNGFGSTGEQ